MRNSQDLNQSPSLRRLSPVVILQNFKNVNIPEKNSLTRNLTSAKVVIESSMQLPSACTDNKTDPIEKAPLDKTAFLNLFNLKPRTSSEDSSGKQAEEEGSLEICPRTSRNSINQLGLSSNIGQKLLHRHLTLNPTEHVLKYEKCCYVSSRYNMTNPRERGDANFTVTYCEKNPPYSHKYLFNKQQRIERLKTISTGLSKRSRKLFQQCKQLKVYLRKISETDIKRLTSRRAVVVERMPVKSIELIDLVDSDEENAPNGSSLSSNKTCTAAKNAAIAKGLAHKPPLNGNGVLFPVQNKVVPLVVLNSLATASKSAATKRHFVNKSITPGGKRMRELATNNSIVRKSPRTSWNHNSALEKDSDPDSDVEIISWNKQKNGGHANNGKMLGLPTAYSSAKATSLDIPNKYSPTSGVLLKCKLCPFVKYCDLIILKEMVQRHMKFSHRGWKEVVVVHRVETCPVRKRLMFVAEAHLKDPIVN